MASWVFTEMILATPFSISSVMEDVPARLEAIATIGKRGQNLVLRCVTALFLAVIGNRPEFVQLLLEAGADPEIKGSTWRYNCTPLEYAQKYEYANIARILQKAT